MYVGDIEMPAVGEDGNVCHHEAVVEQDDNAVKDVKSLGVEILPVWDFERACAWDVIPALVAETRGTSWQLQKMSSVWMVLGYPSYHSYMKFAECAGGT
jgi:hypothetical protein